MNYYHSTILNDIEFDAAIEKVTAALKEQGFGVLTEIDMSGTLKKKLDVDIPNYRILGACNPPAANKALQAEKNIGVFLPCNVVVHQHENGAIEVAAVDPIASMMAVENESLGEVATDIQNKLNNHLSGPPGGGGLLFASTHDRRKPSKDIGNQ